MLLHRDAIEDRAGLILEAVRRFDLLVQSEDVPLHVGKGFLVSDAAGGPCREFRVFRGPQRCDVRAE